MKVRPSVKKICKKCKIIRRKGKVRVFVKTLNINKYKVKEDNKWQELRILNYQEKNILV